MATPCSLTQEDITSNAIPSGRHLWTVKFLSGIRKSEPKSACCHSFIVVNFCQEPHQPNLKTLRWNVKEFEMINNYELTDKFVDWLREIIRPSHDLKTILIWWLIRKVPVVWHHRLPVLPKTGAYASAENHVFLFYQECHAMEQYKKFITWPHAFIPPMKQISKSVLLYPQMKASDFLKIKFRFP